MVGISVEIPSTTVVGKYNFYEVDISVEFNKFKSERYRASKRFSDFVELKTQLSNDSENKLPELPSRYSSFYKSQSDLLLERRQGLTSFVQNLLSDRKFRTDGRVLNFFNIPKSVMAELNMSERNGQNTKKERAQNRVNNITSAQQWMDVYKTTKSLMQDSRSKLFQAGNVVEVKKIMKTCESNLELLQMFLSTSKTLGTGEIQRREELLTTVTKGLTDLNSMLHSMNFADISQKSDNSIQTASLFSTQKRTGTNGRRTLGKVKETGETKLLDNKELLQMQQQKMTLQDQDLDQLKEMIIRQKQIGIAVNEELSIQNELLEGLNQQVDHSSNKMNLARSKIKKFT